MKNELRPTMNVIAPSIRKSQRHPAHPATPRMCKSAKARRDVIIVVVERVVQKKLNTTLDSRILIGHSIIVAYLRRVGSSLEV